MAAGDHRFRDVFRHAPVGIAVVALSGEILEINDAVARMFGYAPEEVTGRAVWDFMTPDDRAAAERDAQATIAAHSGHFVTERRYRRKDGTMTWVEMFAVLERAPDDTPYFIAHILDLTERKRAEAALRASEERYRGIVESQQAAVMRVGLDFRISFVNEHCTHVIGIPAAEMVGQDFTRWIYDEDRDTVIGAVATQIALPPHRANAVSRVKCADGAVRWFEWEGSAVLDADGVPIEMQAVGRDVHERILAEEALRASLDQLRQREQQLRLLAERQVSVREAERRRLGFDLHDGVCQELVGVGIMVELVRRRLEANGYEGVTELGRVTRYVDEIVEHVRVLAGELRPMLLADLGLEGTLRSLTAGMTSETTAVRAAFATEIPRLDDGAELGIYRIAQEALANALRHARARSVDVTLAVAGHALRLEIRDDGCGFDPADRRSQALGLVSMEERAQALGGCFEVQSAAGKGTTVRVEIPLHAVALRRTAAR
jgi:PAS domain S-box-containing protein